MNCPGYKENKPVSFPLPKRGTIEITGLYCKLTECPILNVIPRGKHVGKSFFWTNKGPCFTCKYYNSKSFQCQEVKTLREEYAANREYGWTKDDL